MKLESSVIAVQGYGTTEPAGWGVKDELERATRSPYPLNDISKLYMYHYVPQELPPDEFSWERFLKSGSDLAEDLAILSEQYPNRPIIFIAHSLGGVLLKKALLLAYQNDQDQRFRLLMDCLSGILFLGTPHSSSNDKETFLKHNEVLHHCAKVSSSRQSSKLSTNDIAKLARLATVFEEMASFPILSVFESDENGGNNQRTIQKMFGTKKKPLVDQQLATIHGRLEQTLGVHLSHRELCKLKDVKAALGHYSARSFLRELLEAMATKRTASEGPKTSQDTLQGFENGRPLNPLNLARFDLLKLNAESFGPPTDTPPHVSRAASSIETLLITPGKRILEHRSAKLPCFALSQHSRNLDFTGREKAIKSIDSFLLPREAPLEDMDPDRPRTFSICGMGGIGKTDLAMQYAYLRRDQFDAMFWLEAGGVSQIASSFGQIPAQLGLETPDTAQDLETSIDIAKAWLASATVTAPTSADGTTRGPWLLILNNADVLDVVLDYIPYTGTGSILLTSRDPAAKYNFGNSSGIDLEPLEPEEAARLLHKLSKRELAIDKDEEDASMTVVEKLGRLPLAITQMAGFIRKNQLSIREFIDIYHTDARYKEVHNTMSFTQERRYGHSLATAWSFQGLSSYAMRLLRCMAFMSPDVVQEAIFLEGRGRGDYQRFWRPDTFTDARSELLASSIIKRNIARKELWVHRLIQIEVRIQMNEEERQDAFQEAVRLLGSLWEPGDLCSQPRARWPLCEALMPHLECLYQLWTEYSEAWVSLPVDPALPSLMNEAALYLHERGFSHEGKSYLGLALALCERGSIEQEPLVSDMHLTMGALCNETNDVKGCLKHNILCLKKRQKQAEIDGKANLRLAFAYSQMGIAYMMTKNFARATEYFKQCIEMLKGLKVDPDEFGFPVCNLGLAYWVQGELELADQVLTDLLRQREEIHGKLDQVSYKTGRVLQALGNVKVAKAAEASTHGDRSASEKLYGEGFEMHSNCLKQYESTLGSHNHRTADACHKLAEHHIRMADHALAQDYLDRALSIWGDRPWFRNESARTSFLRGKHLKEMGGEDNITNGEKWTRRALALRRQIVPEGSGEEDLDTDDFDDLVCFWSI